MSRVKTFDSTGLATSGRLYAGDLNAIQDQYADLYNLAQAVGVASMAIGEAGLQLLRYGAGEARISGALRTDGIIRALGGLYAGAFTSTARDAISLGSRPFGLVILNTTTNRLEINTGTDAAPAWSGLSATVTRGVIGAIPAASSANAGSWYFATDDNGGTLYSSDGTTWNKVSRGLTEAITTVMIPNGSVTAAKLDAGVAVVPVGAVMDWPWGSGLIPPWALLPYGQNVLNANYPALQVLGDASARPYGGVAGTNLTLPDYRGSIGVGKDDMGGTAANRITAAISGINGATLGAVGGSEGITLTTAQIPAHNHTFTTGADSVDHSHTLTTGGRSAAHTHTTALWVSGAGGGSANLAQGDNQAAPVSDGAATSSTESSDHAHSGTSSGRSTTHTHSGTTANAGSGGAHPNVQPTIIVNKIMRVL